MFASATHAVTFCARMSCPLVRSPSIESAPLFDMAAVGLREWGGGGRWRGVGVRVGG